MDLIEPPKQEPVLIRYAENDHDVVAIHKFLLVVARPVFLCDVDVVKSLEEIIRVTKEEVAIMAMRGDLLVGTLGLIRPTWWYGQGKFFTDRWNFVVDCEKGGEVGKLLDDEAKAIAQACHLPFVNQGKIRRQKHGNNFLMTPRLYQPDADIYSPEGNA